MSAPLRTEPDNAIPRGNNAAPDADGSAPFEWTVHLLRRDPGRAAGVAVAAIIATVAGIVFFHSIVFGLAGLLLIISSASEFLLPIRYRITAETASIGFGLSRAEIRWSNVRRLIPMSDGVKLSPLPVPSRLDAFRGVLMRFADDGQPGDRAEVMQIIEARMAARQRVEISNPQVRQGV